MNVLRPELTSMLILGSPDEATSIDAVDVSQVSPNASSPFASGTLVPVPDHQRHSYLLSTPVASPASTTRPPRGLLPLPKPKLTIDVCISRAVQHASLVSADPQTPMRSPCEIVCATVSDWYIWRTRAIKSCAYLAITSYRIIRTLRLSPKRNKENRV
ncbi:hypothetical protein EI94DRAFT_1312107 [Lactarius quietus]|nr:hypothetical protein EI94DRAFT_1312107 [Lactarius quietus]